MSAKKLFPHIATLAVAVALIVTQQAWAAPLMNRLASPAATSKTTIAYQGYLTDSSGAPVNETLEMVFKLYSGESGGAPLWIETQPAVGVSQGVFSVLLGSVSSLSSEIIANNGDLWLGVTIGSDEEMAPRDKIASAPYAMMADVPDGSITEYKLQDNAVTSAKIMDGEVTPNDVGFNYAGASAKGGAAADVACSGCVNSTDIQDGQVASADVGFNYAAGTSKGGAATDLSCPGCVNSTDIQDDQVTKADLGPDSVEASELAANSIYSGDIRDGEVKTIDLADGDATSRKVYLTNGHVTTAFTDLNTSWQTINSSSSTFSAETGSKILLVTNCDLQINGLDTIAEVQVYLDGVAQSGTLLAGNEPPYGPSTLLYKWRGTVGTNHLLTVNAGSHTILLKGRTNSGGAHAWRCEYSYVVFSASS